MIQVRYNLGSAWILVKRNTLDTKFKPFKPSNHKKLINYGIFDGKKCVIVDFDKIIDEKIFCKNRFLPWNSTHCYIPLEIHQCVAIVVHSNGLVNFSVLNSYYELPIQYCKSVLPIPMESDDHDNVIGKKKHTT